MPTERRLLAEAGAEVCVVGRSIAPLEQTVQELGDRVWAHSCDVADQEQVEALAGAVQGRWQAIDGLVSRLRGARREVLLPCALFAPVSYL